MGALFIILTNGDNENTAEYRLRIDDIVAYEPFMSPIGVLKTRIDVRHSISKCYALETPEEIDELLMRAKYSTAAVVGRNVPADVTVGTQVYRYDEKEENVES